MVYLRTNFYKHLVSSTLH